MMEFVSERTENCALTNINSIFSISHNASWSFVPPDH